MGKLGGLVARSLAALGLALSSAPPIGADEPGGKDSPRLSVVGTEFRVTTADGRMLAGPDLVGAVVTIDDPTGARLAVRIDAVQRDPKDPSGEIMLYAFAVQDPVSGEWRSLCPEDADGVAMGFPLSGAWTPDGEHLPSEQAFSLSCTRGANAKCVRMGYKPWKTASDGTPLWVYHQACTRMVRADYCGDGTSHTRDGTLINIYDRLGIQTRELAPELTFEAAWGPGGAVCVRKPRIPERVSLDALVRACPAKLGGRVGSACTEDVAQWSGEALILNDSASPDTVGSND